MSLTKQLNQITNKPTTNNQQTNNQQTNNQQTNNQQTNNQQKLETKVGTRGTHYLFN